MDAYPSMLIAEGHGRWQGNAHGMTVWFPTDYDTHTDTPDYETKIYYHHEAWDEFLHAYDDPFAVGSLPLPAR